MHSYLNNIVINFLTALLLLAPAGTYAAQPKSTALGIILIGDTGDDSETKNQVAKAIQKYCAAELCDMALLLGDNFYMRGVSGTDDPQFKTKFEIPYGKLGFPFYPVLGNHDVLGDPYAQIMYQSKGWNMPDRYYEINTNLADIFAIDSNLYLGTEYKLAEKQTDWLINNLAYAKAPWVIVFAHHPIYSNGMHGDTLELIETIQPLIQQYAADFYVSGHDHNKELIERDNNNYIISGAGAKTRYIKDGKDTVFARATPGFAYLLLTKDTAVLRFLDQNLELEYEHRYRK